MTKDAAAHCRSVLCHIPFPVPLNLSVIGKETVDEPVLGVVEVFLYGLPDRLEVFSLQRSDNRTMLVDRAQNHLPREQGVF